GASQPAETPKETQRFLSGKKLVEVRVLRKETDCFPAFDKTTIASKNFRATARWRHQSENNFQGRAFPGTIRTEQTVHLAGFDATIRQVAHPASYIKSFSYIAHRPAEADALHVSLVENLERNHGRWR